MTTVRVQGVKTTFSCATLCTFCICKRSILVSGAAASNIDSAWANLTGSFVNAFVNAGIGNDKLVIDAPEGDSWIYKNKDHGECSSRRFIPVALTLYLRSDACGCLSRAWPTMGSERRD